MSLIILEHSPASFFAPPSVIGDASVHNVKKFCTYLENLDFANFDEEEYLEEIDEDIFYRLEKSIKAGVPDNYYVGMLEQYIYKALENISEQYIFLNIDTIRPQQFLLKNGLFIRDYIKSLQQFLFKYMPLTIIPAFIKNNKIVNKFDYIAKIESPLLKKELITEIKMHSTRILKLKNFYIFNMKNVDPIAITRFDKEINFYNYLIDCVDNSSEDIIRQTFAQYANIDFTTLIY